jgi:hypothetical protein
MFMGDRNMKSNVLVICLAIVCVNGFSEESVAPHAGTFGFLGVIQTPTDSDSWLPANDLKVDPGMGIGFRYHPLNFLMIETLAYASYDVLSNTAGEHFLQVKVAVGAFYWWNLDQSFSIFFGPGVYMYGIWGAADYSQIVRRQFSGLFGLQYCLSKHFAVSCDFGLGAYWVAVNPATGPSGDDWYFKAVLPEVGLVFYL